MWEFVPVGVHLAVFWALVGHREDFPSATGTVGDKEIPMNKYPIIIIGNIRYAPYALMEMQGDEVVSFKPLAAVGSVKTQEWTIKHWLKKLMVYAEGSVHRRTEQKISSRLLL